MCKVIGSHLSRVLGILLHGHRVCFNALWTRVLFTGDFNIKLQEKIGWEYPTIRCTFEVWCSLAAKGFLTCCWGVGSSCLFLLLLD